MSSLKRGRNEFSLVLKPLRAPCSLRKKGELLGQTSVLKQGCASPNMGTEATKSKDVNVIRWSSRSTRYHFFLLAGGTLPVAADCRLRKGRDLGRKPCTVLSISLA
jgi:hypothetical protein